MEQSTHTAVAAVGRVGRPEGSLSRPPLNGSIVSRTRTTMFSKWKTISYRGGLVEFRIPRKWTEEYEHDGGGMFYEPVPDSNTLRLNVITVRSPSVVTAQTPIDLLRPRAQAFGAVVDSLPTGNACVKYSRRAEESGVALLIHYWEVANAVPPSHARIAVFSFTTMAAAEDAASRDLQWLDQEVRTCRFAPELGSTRDNS